MTQKSIRNLAVVAIAAFIGIMLAGATLNFLSDTNFGRFIRGGL